MVEKLPCYPRRRFQSRESADTAAAAIWRRDRKAVTAKRCTECGGWHLN